MKKRSILFVPREAAWIQNNPDDKIPKMDALREKMGAQEMVTLDSKEKFHIASGELLYVFAGHGTAGSGTVYWAKPEYTLTAEEVAQRTAERFPDGINVSIKIYSCHSSEGGYNSFAKQFARAFRPQAKNYEVKIFGYRGSITPRPYKLNDAGVVTGNQLEYYRTVKNKQGQLTYAIPENYIGPKASVQNGAEYRWSKIATPVFQCRASEARDEAAWLKVVDGTRTEIFGPNVETPVYA